MLAIRLQRTGRKGHAQYRMIVQDSRRSPSSGSVVAHLGSYNPHSKTAQIDVQKAQTYLDNGAQPSDRVVSILKTEGVKLPKWVSVKEPGKRATRNPEKLRKNQPEQPKEEAPAEASDEAASEAPEREDKSAEAPAESKEEAPATETEDK